MDQPGLVAIDRDGRVPGALGEPLPAVVEVLRATVEHYRRAGFEQPWICYLGVLGATPIGTCGFIAAPAGGGVEIAYHTFPGCEGRGYATAMATHLVAIAARAIPAVTVTAHTLRERNASHRILEKLGFGIEAAIEHPEDGPVLRWQLVDRGAAAQRPAGPVPLVTSC